MFPPTKYTSAGSWLTSLLGALFIVYPNIACLPWELSFLEGESQTRHLCFFAFRYLFFVLLIRGLLETNLRWMGAQSLARRILCNVLICAAAYGLYVAISKSSYPRSDCFGSTLLFQFFVVCVLSVLFGHLLLLYQEKRKKDNEIEVLKRENLQSQYDALTNQINPHFFFNSLNGIAALIRKKEDEKSLAYVNTLSDVFRYILQSGKRGLVPLREELDFVESFSYLMEVRFANKLTFCIRVAPEHMEWKLPVLSLLPLIDNIVVHNTIDSDHKMVADIWLNEAYELVVSNPVYPKLAAPDSNGTGLSNLENRFSLLLKRHIRIERNEQRFTVYLPLK